jgi:hypothetical protein
MAGIPKEYFVGVLIFVFVVVVIASLQLVKHTEPFTTSGSSPTRALECQCLPGYVAQKNLKTSFYFCQSLTDSTKTRKCY